MVEWKSPVYEAPVISIHKSECLAIVERETDIDIEQFSCRQTLYGIGGENHFPFGHYRKKRLHLLPDSFKKSSRGWIRFPLMTNVMSNKFSSSGQAVYRIISNNKPAIIRPDTDLAGTVRKVAFGTADTFYRDCPQAILGIGISHPPRKVPVTEIAL